MVCVIMAGGKGTRIAGVRPGIPKPMVEVVGKKVLEWQVEALKGQGITDFIFVIGHLGHSIKEHFGSGSKFGVHICYMEEKNPLGTAGALGWLRGSIKENFLLLNGDIIFDVDIRRFCRYHEKKQALATILTHPNNHPQDSRLVETDLEGYVTEWSSWEEGKPWRRNRVNAGIHICSPKLLDMEVFDGEHKIDLDRDVLGVLAGTRGLSAYDSPEYVKDMGTPERLLEVERDIATGKVKSKNLSFPQRAVFFDRDGTLNKYVGFLQNPGQMELEAGAWEAVKEVNRQGWLAIVASNQPVVARGEVSEDELEKIHGKLEALLGQHGAYLDAIYYCPHHPDKGYDGEVVSLKRECDCRKPKPGLLYEAAERYNINLRESWMIGDSPSDILAGKAAGCYTAGIGSLENVEPDLLCKNAWEAVKTIFEFYKGGRENR